MALVTPQVRHTYGSFLPGLIGRDTLAEISQGELEDRLAMAHSLVAKAAGSTPGEQRAATEQARRVLAARARDRVEREVAARIAKASVSDPVRAGMLRDQARELLHSEPPAVRRSEIAKAATAAGRVVVFDDRLRLLGTARRSAVVSNARRVAKAAGKAAGDKPSLCAVFDQDGVLIGVVDPSQIQPVGGSGPKAEPAPRGDVGTPAAGPAGAAPVAKRAIAGIAVRR